MKKLLPVLLLTLAACGKPEVGDSCEANTGTCESSTEALFCEAGRLRALDCNGPLGCGKSTNGGVSCDYSRARAGDSCPSFEESKGQCDAANANQVLLCTWTAQACKGCATQGTSIVCQP